MAVGEAEAESGADVAVPVRERKAVKPPRISRFSQAVRFFRVARLLLWTLWVIYRERRRVIRARERGDYSVQPNVEVLIQVLERFRDTALKLGVLLIKLGQFLSSRADLLPERALAVLGSLQDAVPPAPFSHVAGVIEQELGKPVSELFESIDEQATAAASLGQVHRAVLKETGQQVAVKVQRPNIEQLVASDLSTIRFVIWVISRFVDISDIDLWGFYREFRRTVGEEIDYVREAANAKRFKEMFKDRPLVAIPSIVEGYVSRHVLVLEWVDGIKVNDYGALDAASVNRVDAGKRVVQAYLYQFFEVGFFHADPHPGNIFVLPRPNGGPPGVALVDFGMVGSLTNTSKRGLKDLFLGFLANDAHLMADAMRRLGFIGDGANMAAIERGIGLVVDQYHGLTLGQVRDMDLHEVAHEVEALLYAEPFRIPAQFAFAGKAVGTLSGVATGLSPELNLLEVAVPYAQQFLGWGRDGAGQTIEGALRQLFGTGRTLMSVPNTLERVLTKLDTGQLQVQVGDGAASGRRGRFRRRAARAGAEAGSGSGVATVLMCFAMLGAGAALTVEHAAAAGWLCLGAGVLTGVIAAVRR